MPNDFHKEKDLEFGYEQLLHKHHLLQNDHDELSIQAKDLMNNLENVQRKLDERGNDEVVTKLRSEIARLHVEL